MASARTRWRASGRTTTSRPGGWRRPVRRTGRRNGPAERRRRASVRSDHVAGTLAAAAGAGTKQLMYRLGLASPQTALRYQRAILERDTVIADAIRAMMR